MLKLSGTITSTILAMYMTSCLMGCSSALAGKSCDDTNAPDKVGISYQDNSDNSPSDKLGISYNDKANKNFYYSKNNTTASSTASAAGNQKTTPSISSSDSGLYAPYQVVGPENNGPNMEEVKNKFKAASGSSNVDPAVSALRSQALRETALSLGARGGLAERSQQVNLTLLSYEPVLAKIFQFYGLILDDNVLPPVLVEARNTLNLTGTDALRIADRNYKLIAQARFITAPPTWREYLWMSFDVPEMPDRSLLPRNKPEMLLWQRDLEEGWIAGINQANVIFYENVNRLTRDFNGMILYRKLLAQNMVSQPYVATLDMGVTGSENDMSVNDRVLRITAFPELQSDSSGWKTELHSYE